MNLTRKQLVYLSVCGACVVALVVDKTFLGPSEASAQAMPSTAPTASLAPAAAAPDTPAAMPEGRLAEARNGVAARLDVLARTHDFDLMAVPDAFQPPSAWTGGETDVVTPVRTDDVAAFESAHRLTAVMAGQTRGYAIVDGKGLFIGQELDGFTLVSVSERSAVFETDGRRATLTVSE